MAQGDIQGGSGQMFTPAPPISVLSSVTRDLGNEHYWVSTRVSEAPSVRRWAHSGWPSTQRIFSQLSAPGNISKGIAQKEEFV